MVLQISAREARKLYASTAERKPSSFPSEAHRKGGILGHGQTKLMWYVAKASAARPLPAFLNKILTLTPIALESSSQQSIFRAPGAVVTQVVLIAASVMLLMPVV